MINEKYETKMKDLEQLYHDNFNKYIRRLFLIVLLGYSFLISTLLICAFISILFIYLSIHYSMAPVGFLFAIPFLLIDFLLLTSFVLRARKPQGYILKLNKQPKLANMIKDLEIELKVKVDQIIISELVNAGIQQYPRLGLFGLYTNYLVIGFPLMMSLDEDELKSILAHEYAHISKNHGKFAIKIYRLHQTLNNIYFSIDHNSKLYYIIRRFLSWYVPLFNAYSFFISREAEYTADYAAAKITRPQTVANALIKLDMMSILLNKYFFKEDKKNILVQEQVTINIYTRMLEFIKNTKESSLTDELYENLLQGKTQYIDTHPSLKDRLHALDIQSKPVLDFQNEAFSSIFDNHQDILTIFNEKYVNYNKKAWQYYHQEALKKKKRLEELESQADSLDIKLKLELGNLLEENGRYEEAIKLYNQLQKDHPNALPITFAIGRALVRNDSVDGISYIEKVINRDIRYTKECYELLLEFHQMNNHHYQVLNLTYKLYEFHHLYKRAIIERSKVKKTDQFLPHDLMVEELSALREQLSQNSLIQHIYLVRKKVKYLKEYSLYVIALSFKNISMEKEKLIINQIAQTTTFPGEFIIISLDHQFKQFRPIISSLNHSQIK